MTINPRDAFIESIFRNNTLLASALACLRYVERCIRTDLDDAGEAASAAPDWYGQVLKDIEKLYSDPFKKEE